MWQSRPIRAVAGEVALLAVHMPPVEVEAPAQFVAIAASPVRPDPLRHARQQLQRSILTNSLLDRVLSCGGDIPSYERVLRTFIWTPTITSR